MKLESINFRGEKVRWFGEGKHRRPYVIKNEKIAEDNEKYDAGEKMREIQNTGTLDLTDKHNLVGHTLEITKNPRKVTSKLGDRLLFENVKDGTKVVNFFGSSVIDTQEVVAGDKVKLVTGTGKSGRTYFYFVKA